MSDEQVRDRQPEPPEQRAARQPTDHERAATIRARLALALERRLSDTGRTWDRYATADPGATSRSWGWATPSGRRWSVAVNRDGEVTVGGPDVEVMFPPADRDPVTLALARLHEHEAFGPPTQEQHDATIGHLRDRALQRKADVHGGQTDVFDEARHWRDGA